MHIFRRKESFLFRISVENLIKSPSSGWKEKRDFKKGQTLNASSEIFYYKEIDVYCIRIQ